MGGTMNHLPSIVKQTHLTYSWYYRRGLSTEPHAIVTRHDDGNAKKWYHQYQFLDEVWTEGTATPLPIFGLHLLQAHNSKENIYIFEGERCAEAAHQLSLTGLTSMMGAMQAIKADWTALAQYREHRNYILVPDNDEPGRGYMKTVYEEIRRACPEASFKVCILPVNNKGDDFVDWLRLQPDCPSDWDGFRPIDEPPSEYLKNAFEKLIESSSIPVDEFFSGSEKPPFIEPFEPLVEEVFPIKECPIDAFAEEMRHWMSGYAEQMQVPVDYLAAPLLVYLGTAIGRKRGVRVRQEWVEFPNLWGMIIGKPSLMKSPAMKAMQKPLAHLIKKAKAKYDESHLQYVSLHDKWIILKKAQEDQFKGMLKTKLKNGPVPSLNEIAELSIEQEPQKPMPKRYRTDDATVEKMGELLIENPQGILLFRDELSG